MSDVSNSDNYVIGRDDIIKRALRIIGAIGQGETPQTQAVTEAAQALNELIKEWNADGLQLHKYYEYELTAPSGSFNIGLGSNAIDTYAPTKILSAYRRTGTGVNRIDVPLTLYTRHDWEAIPNKYQTGTPIALYYRTPRMVPAQTGNKYAGQINLWPVPDSTFTTTNSGKIVITYMAPLMDFDTSTDYPDIPQHYFNALVWGLADQLAYEYGLGPVEKSQIGKKAEKHKTIAMAFDQEEGSLFIYPDFEGYDR